MSFEWIPYLLFGFLLLFVGIRLNGHGSVYDLAKLGLILGGLILVGWGIFAAFDELSA